MQKGKTRRLNLISIALITLIFPVEAEKPGYGYLLHKDSTCDVWWAEGAYKIMKEDPVPEKKSTAVEIWTARNEYEPFQVVLHPNTRLEQVRISMVSLINDQGDILDQENIIIRQVEYVNVTKPTDSYGKTGWWPDPLPLYDGPFTAYPGQNYPFWITVKVPENTKPGIYRGIITLTSSYWKSQIPVQLEVWGFALPDKVSIRSAFGVRTGAIQQYHNLESDKELEQVTDKYYKSLKEHRLCPTSPFELYPVNIKTTGIDWEGGVFDKDTVFAGNQSYKLTDESFTETTQGKCRQMIRVDSSVDYKLAWFVKTEQPGQRYSVLVKGYNSEKEYLPFENRMDVFRGREKWRADTLSLGKFRPEVKYITIHLFPVFRDLTGSSTGIAWFDNVSVISYPDYNNILPGGDFEVDVENISIKADFTKFDKAAGRYLDDFGFNSYNLRLEGMPSGNYYSQRLGMFEGFIQGSPEYEVLMKRYLSQVQDHLERNGWLGKEYIYWFDEPNRKDYPFVREGMGILNRSAPKIIRFITEHQPGPDIMDVSDISCTIWHRMDPDMVAKLVKEGREFWSYLCCWPKSPWISEFIDHDAVNLRMWLWMSYKYQLKGILIWSTTYWNSDAASPKGYLQNPWEDPMSYVRGYGWLYGKQTIWGNGDGRFFYPPNRNPNDHSGKYLDGPIPSLRLEILREGIEDYEYLILLEKAIEKAGRKQKDLVVQARKLLQFPGEMFTDGKTYNKDPQYLLLYRKEIAGLLNDFYTE